jgi:hypothetical protein
MVDFMQMYDLAFFARKIAWTIKYKLVIKRSLLRRKTKIKNAGKNYVWPAYVLDGVFKGMKYLSNSTGSAYYPKILGSYESYLHKWVDKIIDSSPDRILVVGCAEGYYAVGFKFRMNNTTVIAFDINETARSMCCELAKLNNVFVEVRERFNPSDYILDNAIIIMDVEGAESELLSSNNISRYRHAEIIVEAHNFIFGHGNLTKNIIHLFEKSHHIEIIQHQDAGAVSNNARDVLGMTDANADILVDELRAGRNDWLRLSPKHIYIAESGLCE